MFSASRSIQGHTQVRSPTFVTCGRDFLTHSHMKTHFLVHTGEKPYLCSICGKGFVTNKDLQRHGLIHIANKPYMCSLCGKGFCQKSQLEPHMMKKQCTEGLHLSSVWYWLS